ncbi:sigma-70 family RNA polymerase sigma factor [Cellulomonas sp. JZ18]|uniref:RNA polymerase sigma factor n=1 Tax=Cellulomonas sp. JZ18 TaxID=2654191 RepID=UPI0012D45CEB|nr:RNA polymerase sigma factor [Cellulomonas sp. JZ18]QGQ20357.1 sigma-70 family RNA polymerase sigma factor [Cellulomonas sp. JZ18]
MRRRPTPDERLTVALDASGADLLAYLTRRVGPADAADLLADAMVAAWRRVDDLPVEPERARMWLFGIARNTLLNHHRGEVRRRRLADRVREALAGDAATAPAADAGAEVRDAVARLDPDLAELVRLVHWDGFTLAEAAELTGVPASTARSRYQRARGELRAALGVGARAS